jgi:hypothetical protein
VGNIGPAGWPALLNDIGQALDIGGKLLVIGVNALAFGVGVTV